MHDIVMFHNQKITSEELGKIIEEINGHTVLVEGKQDLAALSNFGISDVISISGKPLEKFVDALHGIVKTHDVFTHKKPLVSCDVLVLTDFDHEGKQLAKRITTVLQHLGVRTNTPLRKKIHKTLGIIHVSEIEKIKTEDDYNGKIAAINNKIPDRSTTRSGRGCGKA